jgi:hypothetical protein
MNRSSIEHETLLPPADPESLGQGTSGAIMVIGAFMAMFLVGLLYFSIGIGGTILFRERMQDASDAASFSAAVMNARGMNLIALINMIMAAVLAILVALRAVSLLCLAGIALAAALAWPTAGASLSAIPPLNSVRTGVERVYSSLERPVHQILKAGHKAGVAVRQGMPYVAQGKAITIVMTSYDPPAQIGFVYPLGNRPLPTEDAPFSELCDKAADYVTAVVMLPLNPVLDLLGPVKNFVEGAISLFTRAAAATVCGGSASIPDLGVDFSRNLPESPEVIRCRDEGDPAVCEAAQRQQERQQFDPSSGYCKNNIPAGSSRYECLARTEAARNQCRPQSGRTLKDYTYQVAEMVVDVTKHEGRLMVGSIWREDPDYRGTNPHVERSATPLCGLNGTVDTAYGAGTDEDPLCQTPRDRIEARASLEGLLEGQTVQIKVRRVIRMLGCKDPSGGPDLNPSSDFTPGGNDESPQRVRNGLRLGDDEFQIRGFVVGTTDWDREYRGVQAANQWRDSGGATNTFRSMAQMGRISVAQAEFYYAGSETDPGEWLWHMSWRARLRRFRMPPELAGSGGDSALKTACGSGESCNSIGGLDLSFLERVIIH